MNQSENCHCGSL